MKEPWQQQQDVMRQHQQQLSNQMRQQQEIQQYQMRQARQKNEVLRQPQEQRQDNDPFARVELEAIELREAHASGRVSDQELQDRLDQLMVEDERGAWWTIDLESMAWVRYDGAAWVHDSPPHPTLEYITPQKTNSTPAWLYLLMMVILVATFAGVFIATTSTFSALLVTMLLAIIFLGLVVFTR